MSIFLKTLYEKHLEANHPLSKPYYYQLFTGRDNEFDTLEIAFAPVDFVDQNTPWKRYFDDINIMKDASYLNDVLASLESDANIICPESEFMWYRLDVNNTEYNESLIKKLNSIKNLSQFDFISKKIDAEFPGNYFYSGFQKGIDLVAGMDVHRELMDDTLNNNTSDVPVIYMISKDIFDRFQNANISIPEWYSDSLTPEDILNFYECWNAVEWASQYHARKNVLEKHCINSAPRNKSQGWFWMKDVPHEENNKTTVYEVIFDDADLIQKYMVEQGVEHLEAYETFVSMLRFENAFEQIK